MKRIEELEAELERRTEWSNQRITELRNWQRGAEQAIRDAAELFDRTNRGTPESVDSFEQDIEAWLDRPEVKAARA